MRIVAVFQPHGWTYPEVMKACKRGNTHAPTAPCLPSFSSTVSTAKAKHWKAQHSITLPSLPPPRSSPTYHPISLWPVVSLPWVWRFLLGSPQSDLIFQPDAKAPAVCEWLGSALFDGEHHVQLSGKSIIYAHHHVVSCFSLSRTRFSPSLQPHAHHYPDPLHTHALHVPDLFFSRTRAPQYSFSLSLHLYISLSLSVSMSYSPSPSPPPSCAIPLSYPFPLPFLSRLPSLSLIPVHLPQPDLPLLTPSSPFLRCIAR